MARLSCWFSWRARSVSASSSLKRRNRQCDDPTTRWLELDETALWPTWSTGNSVDVMSRVGASTVGWGAYVAKQTKYLTADRPESGPQGPHSPP